MKRPNKLIKSWAFIPAVGFISTYLKDHLKVAIFFSVSVKLDYSVNVGSTGGS